MLAGSAQFIFSEAQHISISLMRALEVRGIRTEKRRYLPHPPKKAVPPPRFDHIYAVLLFSHSSISFTLFGLVHDSQLHPPRECGRAMFPTPVGPMCPSGFCFSRSMHSSH